MAKSKSKSKSKAKAKAKSPQVTPTGRRGRKRLPEPGTGGVVSFLRPRLAKPLAELARKMAAGESVSASELDSTLISVADYKALVARRNEIAEQNAEPKNEGEDALDLPTVPPLYQPFAAEAAKRLGAWAAFHGQASKNTQSPDAWSSRHGNWREGVRLAAVRTCHIADIRKIVDDEFKVTVKDTTYVVGTSEIPAAMAIIPSRGDGTYGTINQVGKRLSLGSVAELSNVVFQINSKVAVIRHDDDGTKPGQELVWMPNQVATAGRVYRGDKALTALQFRAAVEKGETDWEFRPLEKEILGYPYSHDELFREVKRAMSLKATVDESGQTAWDRFLANCKDENDARAKIIRNAGVMTRSSPSQMFAFGIRHGPQWHIAVVPHFDEAGETPQFSWIVGARIGAAYAENRWDARERAGDKGKTEPAKAKTEPAKAKTEPAKAKSEPKRKEAKSEPKRKEAKSEPKRKARSGKTKAAADKAAADKAAADKAAADKAAAALPPEYVETAAEPEATGETAESVEVTAE